MQNAEKILEREGKRAKSGKKYCVLKIHKRRKIRTFTTKTKKKEKQKNQTEDKCHFKCKDHQRRGRERERRRQVRESYEASKTVLYFMRLKGRK